MIVLVLVGLVASAPNEGDRAARVVDEVCAAVNAGVGFSAALKKAAPGWAVPEGDGRAALELWWQSAARGVPVQCGGAAGVFVDALRELMLRSSELADKQVAAFAPLARRIDGLPLRACSAGAVDVVVVWWHVDGQRRVLVTGDGLDAATERCVWEAASALPVVQGTFRRRYVLPSVESAAPKPPRVLPLSADDEVKPASWARSAETLLKTLTPIADLADCWYDTRDGVERRSVVVTRLGAEVTIDVHDSRGASLPEVPFSSCVTDRLRKAGAGAARASFVFRFDVDTADRRRHLAPVQQALVAHCSAVTGKTIADRRAALVERLRADASPRPELTSLSAALNAVNPRDRPRRVEAFYGDHEVACPAANYESQVRTREPAVPLPTAVDVVCAAVTDLGRNVARTVAVAEEAHFAEFGSYADAAALSLSAFPGHKVTAKTTPDGFFVRVEGSGVAAGDVWETDESTQPRHVQSACALP